MKTTEEELLGAYSTKQLAMYLRFNNFIELAETVERVELRGKHLRNCCRASSTGQEQQRREEEAGVFNVENDERIVLEVCELFGCTAEEAKRMCEELVKDFADVPWDETNPSPPEGKAVVGVPIGGGGGKKGRRVLRLEDRGGDTVGGALMREVPPDGYRKPGVPAWYDKPATKGRWGCRFRRKEEEDEEEEGEEQNDRERRLRERERKVEEREKRMDEIEARLKRLEENGGTTAPSA